MNKVIEHKGWSCENADSVLSRSGQAQCTACSANFTRGDLIYGLGFFDPSPHGRILYEWIEKVWKCDPDNLSICKNCIGDSDAYPWFSKKFRAYFKREIRSLDDWYAKQVIPPLRIG